MELLHIFLATLLLASTICAQEDNKGKDVSPNPKEDDLIKLLLDDCISLAARIKLFAESDDTFQGIPLVPKEKSFVGDCNKTIIVAGVITVEGWKLALEYKKIGDKFGLSNITLNFREKIPPFEKSSDSDKIKTITSETSNLSAKLEEAIKAGSKLVIDLKKGALADSTYNFKLEIQPEPVDNKPVVLTKESLNKNETKQETQEGQKLGEPASSNSTRLDGQVENNDSGKNTTSGDMEKSQEADSGKMSESKSKLGVINIDDINPVKIRSLCLTVNAKIKIVIDYPTNQNGTQRKEFPLFQEKISTNGTCRKAGIFMEVKNELGWTLKLSYPYNEANYSLSEIELQYHVDEHNFPDVAESFKRNYTVTLKEISMLSTERGYSCKYDNKIVLDLGEHETLVIGSYDAHAFKENQPTRAYKTCAVGPLNAIKTREPKPSSLEPSKPASDTNQDQDKSKDSNAEKQPKQSEGQNDGQPKQTEGSSSGNQTSNQVAQPSNTLNGPNQVGEAVKQTPRNASTPFSFTVPRRNPGDKCLKLDIMAKIVITYPTKNKTEAKKEIDLDEQNFSGKCSEGNEPINVNTLLIKLDNANLSFAYNTDMSNSEVYKLRTIDLYYLVDSRNYPDVADEFIGHYNVTAAAGFVAYSTKISSSYKCTAETIIELGKNVILNVTYYHGQPFTTKDAFDTAVICPEEVEKDSCKMFGVYVGIALCVLILLIVIVFKIYRSRPGFEKIRLEPSSSRFV